MYSIEKQKYCKDVHANNSRICRTNVNKIILFQKGEEEREQLTKNMIEITN